MTLGVKVVILLISCTANCVAAQNRPIPTPDFSLLKRLLALHLSSGKSRPIVESNSITNTNYNQEKFYSKKSTTTDFPTDDEPSLFDGTTESEDAPLEEEVTLPLPTTTTTTTTTEASTTMDSVALEKLHNNTVMFKIKSLLDSALPRLKRLLDMKPTSNDTASSDRQRAELLQLAAQIQPFLFPSASPVTLNHTTPQMVLGTGLAEHNRTGRGEFPDTFITLPITASPFHIAQQTN